MLKEPSSTVCAGLRSPLAGAGSGLVRLSLDAMSALKSGSTNHQAKLFGPMSEMKTPLCSRITKGGLGARACSETPVAVIYMPEREGRTKGPGAPRATIQERREVAVPDG